MKITFFWSRIPEYAQACLSELQKLIDVKVYSLGQAPAFLKEPLIDFEVLDPQDDKFYDLCKDAIAASDVIVASGWMYPQFCQALLDVKKTKQLTAIGMVDTPWKDSIKQELRALLGKNKIQKLYDIIWVPGARALPLAHRLGYSGKKLLQGLYCANTNKFLRPVDTTLEKKQSFIFVGRLVKEKNIAGLLKAYETYVQSTDQPWSLEIIGDGSMKKLIPENNPLITSHGALAPDEVLPLLQQSSCFILASHFEPWGVVVHEAACIGLPIIASQDVCATAELVRDGFNGRIFDANSPHHIAQSMTWISEHKDLQQLSKNSYSLAQSNTVQNWAQMFITRLEEMG
jgi:glycosyltransferase involved in cell wall biosynthesis